MMSMRGRTASLVAAALLPAAVLLGAPPASAADVFVQVDPDTVAAGQWVRVKASCRVNNLPATVESQAFGTVTVRPQAGFLIASAMIPRETRASTYRVRLSCPDGKSASSRLMVVGGDTPHRGPATGFGGSAHEHPGRTLLATGLGTTVTGLLLGVLALRRRSGAARRRAASGRTGD